MEWALIGASTIAKDYVIRAIRAQEGHDVRTVLSSSAKRGAAYAAEQGIARSDTDLDTILADPAVGAVYISTTNEKHFPQAMAAIAAGKHVLCEKPLAMTLSDAVTMVRAAERAGVAFATNHHLRCSGAHRAIRDMVAAGRIGRVLSMRIFHAVHLPPHLQGWRINDAAAGGGVIPDITVHDADVARFILGEDPAEVVAQMGASGMGAGVEDSAMSVWSMPSGAMVMSHESFTHPFAGSGLELHGDRGSIIATGVMTQQPVGEITLITEEGREVVPFSDHDLYVQGLSDFAAAIRGQGAPAGTGWDGVKSLAVAHAVRKAAQTGLRQTVDYGGAP
ncbi:MAG: Gfo/Idh/MocA family oxidoreductase [Pseudomonadota bacterium]